MPIIIDGWNLIRNENSEITDEENDALDSAGTLLSYLNDFQNWHNDPIIVVFDSTHEHLDMEYTNSAKLKVIPARDADEYIQRYIDKIPHRERRNTRVVSSDKEVYFYAKSSGATALKAEDFWDKLYRDRKRCADEDAKKNEENGHVPSRDN